MKRTLLIAFALLVSGAASAQTDVDRPSFDFSRQGAEHKHEVRLTVGISPLFENDFYIYDGEVVAPKYPNTISPDDLTYRGALKTSGGYALSYMYSPLRWFSVVFMRVTYANGSPLICVQVRRLYQPPPNAT